jgi:hypothetical protein
MKVSIAAVSLCLGCVILACAGLLGPPEGSPETGYAIYGYVGKTSQEVAPGQSVDLLSGESQVPMGNAVTNWAGQYEFTRLQPGSYLLLVGEIRIPVVLRDRNKRLDIDLSKPGGQMDYAGDLLRQTLEEASREAGQTAGPTNPGEVRGADRIKQADPALVKALSGKYWGYSGTWSMSGGGGGTERNWALCPDGTFHYKDESSYYGSGSDTTGAETNNWSVLGAGANVIAWYPEGTPQSGTIIVTLANDKEKRHPYRMGDSPDVYIFNGITMSRKGPCD